MKFIILLFLTGHVAIAAQYEFNQITTMEGFSIKFHIENDNQSKYQMVLDCQSFFKKADILNANAELLHENYIDINACEFLYLNTVGCFDDGKNKCFDTDDLYRESCLCDP